MSENLITAQRELEHSLARYKQACCIADSLNFTPHTFSDLDAAVNAHERFVQSLGEATSHAGTILKKIRNHCLSVNRLHPELLVKIIQLDASHYSCTAGYGHLSEAQRGIARLISLSRVCFHWRQLIMEFGILWSRVPLGTTPQSSRIVQLCLERAQNSGLDISAFTRTNGAWMGHDVLFPLHRINSLSMDARTPDQIHSVMKYIFCNAHDPSCGPRNVLLKFAGLTANNRVLIPSDLSLQQGLNNSFGRLNRLRLSGVDLDWSQCVLNELQTLSMDDPFSSWRLARIAIACPNLRVLELSPSLSGQVDIDPSEESESPSLSLFPGLKILRITCHQLDTPQRVLRSILPGAYEVGILIYTEPQFGRLRSAVGKFNNVTELGILGSYIWLRDKDEQVSIPKVFPNVHTLYWNEPHFNDRMLSFLDAPRGGQPVLPKLRTLKLRGGLISSRVMDRFIAMVLNYPIQHLELRIFRTETETEAGNRLIQMDAWSPQYLLLSKALPSVSISHYDPYSAWR